MLRLVNIQRAVQELDIQPRHPARSVLIEGMQQCAEFCGVAEVGISTILADLLTLLFLADPGSAVRTSLRT